MRKETLKSSASYFGTSFKKEDRTPSPFQRGWGESGVHGAFRLGGFSLISTLLLAVLLSFPSATQAQNFPNKSNRLVNDYTNTLSSSQVQRLEQKLVQYDNETSVQIAIVILKTLDGYPIDDYAFSLGEKWGVGSAGFDNGALVLVSMEERKMWIATGYGLESTVTDALCKRIVENEMKPRFRSGDFAGGLEAASDAIILASKGEYAGKGNGGGNGEAPPIGALVVIFLVFGFVILIKAMQVRRYARVNHMGFWAAWMLLNAASRRHSGSWSSFSGGSGGFGGGGGFGGFGGGSFGGGGAGGSW